MLRDTEFEAEMVRYIYKIELTDENGSKINIYWVHSEEMHNAQQLFLKLDTTPFFGYVWSDTNLKQKYIQSLKDIFRSKSKAFTEITKKISNLGGIENL